MKRVFISIIAFAAALNLCACSDNSEHKSKSNDRTSSKVETQDKTEKETLPDIANKYTMVDAFENVEPDIYNEKYPNEMWLTLLTRGSIYGGKMKYHCIIKSMDTEKIVIEAKADTDEYTEDLKEMGYKFESNVKTYEIDINQIASYIINKSQLDSVIDDVCKKANDVVLEDIKSNNKSSKDLEEMLEGHTGEAYQDMWDSVVYYNENVKPITYYALIPPEGTVFLSDQQCNGTDEPECIVGDTIGSECEIINPVSSPNYYCIIEDGEKNYYIVSGTPVVKEGKLDSDYDEKYTIEEIGSDKRIESKEKAVEYISERLAELQKKYKFDVVSNDIK
ncbi:hypothetical protein [Ruminococcus sp.]|uniref:hypothetical protein n=1 Tax=Ruminococcus sp. TaxID=41978 RepID=UPI0025FA9B31|nr:hypothetical protein [Ruminococcus sp.]MBQ6252438.1 hypothetical protein [Ruminococcus sp.]